MSEPVLRLRLALAGAAFSAFVGAACSLIVDASEQQCSKDGDCAARGPAFAQDRCVGNVCIQGGGGDAASDAPPDDGGSDPRWSCLGSVKPPTFPKPTLAVSVPLVDLVTQKPVTAIDAKVCGKADVACAQPIGQTVSPNAQGILAFTLPAGFDGYVELTSNAPADDAGLPAYVPSLVFFNPPLSADTIYITVPLVSPQALASLAAQFGNTIDPSLGAPFAVVQDCKLEPAEGVSVSIDQADASTRTFYFVNSLPSESAKVTDPTGYSGFINVPPGIRSITGTIADAGARVGTVSVLVRPSTLTYTVLAPTP